MKQIVVIVAGTGQPRDLRIEPGTTARDILSELGLQDYVLSKDSAQHPFGANENVYTEVDDGEKIYAAPKADVGRAAVAGR
jgi:hypothetical protein